MERSAFKSGGRRSVSGGPKNKRQVSPVNKSSSRQNTVGNQPNNIKSNLRNSYPKCNDSKKMTKWAPERKSLPAVNSIPKYAWKVNKLERQSRGNVEKTKEEQTKKLQATHDWEVIEKLAEATRNEVEKEVKQAVAEFKAQNGEDAFSNKHPRKSSNRGSEIYRGPPGAVSSKSPSALKKAQAEFDARIKRKNAEFQRRLNEAADRKKKLDENIQQRKANFKVYNKKTRKGQPVMAARMELLLKKIQSSQ